MTTVRAPVAWPQCGSEAAVASAGPLAGVKVKVGAVRAATCAEAAEAEVSTGTHVRPRTYNGGFGTRAWTGTRSDGRGRTSSSLARAHDAIAKLRLTSCAELLIATF